MRTIFEVADRQLAWVNLPRGLYELRADGDVVARLRYFYGWARDAAHQEGEVEGRRLIFRGKGFWRPRVIVLAPESQTPIAVFRSGAFGGGPLEFADGRSIQMKAGNRWHTELVWVEHGEVLVRFTRRRTPWFKPPTHLVTITTAGRRVTELPLLVLLGFRQVLESLKASGDGG